MYICRSIVRVAWGGECWEDMDCWWWNFWHEILRCSVIVILSPYLRVVTAEHTKQWINARKKPKTKS